MFFSHTCTSIDKYPRDLYYYKLQGECIAFLRLIHTQA